MTLSPLAAAPLPAPSPAPTPAPAQAIDASPGPTVAPAPPRANPQLRIDAALNMVVLEFRGADGAVRHTLPTSRELDAYRQGMPVPPAKG